MTTPSGEPYQYGDDTVAARLEVDVPADAINSLSDLSRLTADIRANMEATAKYNRDYVEYLRELPSAIGEIDSAQTQLSASQSSIFGGESVPRDPFAGRPTATASGSPVGQVGGGRPMRGVDQDALIELARNNPRQVANMAAERGLDDYFDEEVQILPRPAPSPRPGSGRGRQFSGGGRPPSGPTSPRTGTSPGDDDGRAAGTGTGRQVTPEGTESQSERAAKRLLAELGQGGDTRDLGERARDLGTGFQNNSLLNFLTNEGGVRGRGNWLEMGGQLGKMGQDSAGRMQKQAAAAEAQRQKLLASAAEVSESNPELAAQLTEQAGSLGAQTSRFATAAPLLRGAAIGGGVLAGAAAVGAGVQKAGSTYMDVRGEGVQMGGGFAEGAAFESQIRTMAMNPFISTEQSRKIMQSALQSGYTGKEMDTMTEFMAENLKNMNMEVAESTKLLQQNVLKGGQDVGSVQAQLAQNQMMAGNVNMSFDQINDAYTRLSGGFINQGFGGEQAGETAQLFSTMFADNEVLKNTGADMLAGLSSNPTFQNYFSSRSGAREAGISSSNSTMWAGENLSSEEYLQSSIEAQGDMLRPFVSMYTSGDDNLRMRAIQQAASRLKIGIPEATALLDEYASGDILNRPAQVQQEWEEVGGGRINEKQGGFMGRMNPAQLGDIASGAGHMGKRAWNAMFGDEESKENARAGYEQWEAEFTLDTQLVNAGSMNPTTGKTYTPEVLEQMAVAEHGGNIHDVTIVDENGRERKLTQQDLINEGTMKKLQSGDIQVKSSEGIQTLREWGNTQNTSDLGGANQHVVTLSDEARRFFRIEGPNTQQQRADQGRGTRNSSDAGIHGYGPQTGPN